MLPNQILNRIIGLQEDERREYYRHFNMERRIMREDSDPFTLSNSLFKDLFRLNKEMRTIGQSWNLSLSQQSVSRCIKEVSTLIVNHLAPDWILFPNTPNEINKVKAQFMRKTRFPGVLGAIDCTHISIIAPVVEEHNYLNRKGYHSKNVQIICDADLLILNINSRYPGAVHDSFIWRNSVIHEELRHRYNAGDTNSWLLGDSGYPQQPWLMTPIVNAAPGTPEFIYTERHVLSRNVIERLNGVFKGRFRCISQERKLRYDPVTVGKIVTSCAVLHNLCIKGGLQMDINIPAELPEHVEVQHMDDFNNGFDARRQLIAKYFA
ncbi:hypothetical protein NQ314_011494 [Rhamnusium bicolor]|uniref:Putative nuclease HARBI1 n=1 Tax=Rhamnusium bicolor TaxID=1586634 RepID=A0AAV8XKD4_9CUCU|nr:hypothetical protein NQ314_017669 [Rhamnusium bicolor]KAJ8938457.1 hypothetical protein NQ314_011494 [Rhamnusium bicolor]